MWLELLGKLLGLVLTLNNLLPGMHDTKRLIDLDKALSKEKGISFEEARN